MTRIDPPQDGTPEQVVLSFLDYQRETLAIKVAGLDDDQLKQRLDPSEITLGGLLRHMTYVEQYWVMEIFEGRDEPEPWASAPWEDDDDWEWHSADQCTGEDLLAAWRSAVDHSREVLRATDFGQLSAKVGVREGEPFNAGWIAVHLLEEYARHLGHADLIRESIDGEVGDGADDGADDVNSTADVAGSGAAAADSTGGNPNVTN